jgi:hypothetical protein
MHNYKFYDIDMIFDTLVARRKIDAVEQKKCKMFKASFAKNAELAHLKTVVITKLLWSLRSKWS